MTHPTDSIRPGPPTVREIAELTARLREITASGRHVDPAQDAAERAAFLADKDALLARIAATDPTTDDVRGSARVRAEYAQADALSDTVRGRAAQGGYVLIGPSARTWSRDPDTGRPLAPVADAEHRAVRELLGREVLDTDEPQWVTGDDGRDDIHSTVTLHAAREVDDDGDPDEREFDELCERCPLPGDPGGPEPATSGYGPAWVDDADYLDHDAPIGADTATANPDIWDRDPVAGPTMPEWMREQARRAEADIATGTTPPVRDETAELAARADALRDRNATHDPGPGTESEYNRPSCLVEVEVGDDARREQLIRWHADDQATEQSTEHGVRFICGDYPARERD